MSVVHVQRIQKERCLSTEAWVISALEECVAGDHDWKVILFIYLLAIRKNTMYKLMITQSKLQYQVLQ